MEREDRLGTNETIDFSRPVGPLDERCLQARTQAFEEAVAMALFASAWLQHSRQDAQASRTAKLIARLLAATTGSASLHGFEPFAAARKFLEDANG
jgi:hypothetical protein